MNNEETNTEAANDNEVDLAIVTPEYTPQDNEEQFFNSAIFDAAVHGINSGIKLPEMVEQLKQETVAHIMQLRPDLSFSAMAKSLDINRGTLYKIRARMDKKNG